MDVKFKFVRSFKFFMAYHTTPTTYFLRYPDGVVSCNVDENGVMTFMVGKILFLMIQEKGLLMKSVVLKISGKNF
ncbi:MAG: hypothetical protein QXY45_01380 [Candidatus Aenigmatarchaeota archaeon]